MRKINLLFVNVLLFVILTVIGFLIYANFNQYDEVAIFDNMTYLKSMATYLGIPFLLTLLTAIPLGRLPKKENTKVDCAVICVLLSIVFIVISIILNSQAENLGNIFNDLYLENLNNEIYKVLAIGVISYILFLFLVLVLRYTKIVVFEAKPEINKKKPNLAVVASLVAFVGGIGGVLLYIFLKGNRTNGYYPSVIVQDWGVLASFSLFYLMVSCFTEYKKPGAISTLIYNLVFVGISLVIYFGLKNNEQYPNSIFSLVFILWAIGTELVFVLLNEAIRPFARFIAKGKNNEEIYATKEDFVLLTEALAASNKRNDLKDIEEKDFEKEESKEDNTKEAVEIQEEKTDELSEEEKAKLAEQIKVEEDKKKYIIHLEDENRILKARLDDLDSRIKALESKKLDLSGAKDNTSDESNLANAPHYETETVSIIRKGFKSRLISDAPQELKDCYISLVNLTSKYKKAKVRESFSKEVIHVGRQNVAILKMSPSGKAMYLFLSLDKSYLDGKYHLKDFSEKKAYTQTPLRLRIKSARSIQYAYELLEIVLNNNAEKYKLDRETIDISEKLKPQTEAEMIRNGLIKKHVVENTYLVEPIFEDKALIEDEEDEKEE